MRVLILGTGSTIGTLREVAPAADLGVCGFTERLSRMKPRWREDYAALAPVVDDCGSANLDEIWTHLDYTVKLQRSLGGNPYAAGASGELHRALLDAYSLTDEIGKVDLRSDFTLKAELARLADGDVLISFNWDTTAERIATDLGKRLVVASGRVLDNGSVNLVKPHGSLSWEDGGADRVKWHEDGRPLLTPMPVEAVHRGGYMQPLVLGAVPMKERLIRETQPNSTIFEVFADQWAAVVGAVASATELTVIGYRFPPEDHYGRFLLKEAARRRAAALPGISYYSLDPDRVEIERALREIFGELVPCNFEGPALPASAKPA